jgi:hypothetical protein
MDSCNHGFVRGQAHILYLMPSALTSNSNRWAGYAKKERKEAEQVLLASLASHLADHGSLESGDNTEVELSTSCLNK